MPKPAKRPSLPQVKYKFSYELATRFADEDNQRILNHATNFMLIEEARFEYMVASGSISREEDVPFYQHSNFTRFVSPGRAPAATIVSVATIHLGSTSFTQSYQVADKETGQVWVECIQTLVMYDRKHDKPTNISSKIRRCLSEFDQQQNLDPINAMPVNETLRGLTALTPYEGPFRYGLPMTTRWLDEDRFGKLSGNIYFTLIEDGRAQYFGKRGLNVMTKNNAFPFVILSSALRYFKPGRGSEDVVVDVRTIHMGGSSFTQHYRIRHATTGEIWCEAEQVFVFWDVLNKHKKPIDAEFRLKTGLFDALPTTLPAKVVLTRSDPKLLNIGDKASLTKTFTQNQVAEFAELSDDRNPLHLDAKFAAKTPFKKPIMHGALSSSLFSGLLGAHLPGPGAIYLGQTTSFKAPAFPETALTATVEITKIRQDKGIVTLTTTCTDATTQRVLVTGQAVVKVSKSQIAASDSSTVLKSKL